MSAIRLTQYSHGAGCGCKIAPDVLDGILAKAGPGATHSRLIVGNQGREDAAVYDLGDGRGSVRDLQRSWRLCSRLCRGCRLIRA